MKPIFLADLDNTLADYEKALISDMLSLMPTEEVCTAGKLGLLDDVHKLENHCPAYSKRAKLIKRQKGWWLNLEPIEKGIALLREAERIGYEVQILTKGPSSNTGAWSEKIEWVRKHIGDNKTFIVENKAQVYGKVLYDDWISYVQDWLEWRPRGLVIMPETNYNKDFSHPNVRKHKTVLFQQKAENDRVVEILQGFYTQVTIGPAWMGE